MKIQKNYIYSCIFIIIVLLQLYVVSYKISFGLQLLILLGLLFDAKLKIKKYFILVFGILASLLILGFVGTFIHQWETIDIIKDVIFITKPLVSFCLAYLIANAIANKEIFIRSIIFLGLICCFIHFYILLFLVNFSSIHAIREYTKDNFIEVFALFFVLGYHKIFNKKFSNKKWINYAIIGCLVFSNFFYFSRMTIIISMVLTLAYFGFTRINKLNLTIVATILFSVIGLFTVLNSMTINRNSKGFEAFLFKIKNSPKEMLNTKIDINNHQQLWDHWRGYEAKRAFILMKDNPSSYIIGNGHGSLVNLKFMAPLSAEKKGLKYISHIHNGYAFIFYKLGSVGLLMYLFFLIKIYLLGQQKNNFIATVLSSIAIIYFLTTLTITGIYNQTENIIFVLGGLIFYYTPHIQQNKTLTINE